MIHDCVESEMCGGGKCDGGKLHKCKKCKKEEASKLVALIKKRVPTHKLAIRRPGVNVLGKNVMY